MESVSPDRGETRGRRSSSRQGQLRAAETWAGRNRELLPEMPLEGGFGQLPAIPAVQTPSMEQLPGLLSHPAEPLPSKPQGPWHESPAAKPPATETVLCPACPSVPGPGSFGSLGRSNVGFLFFSPPAHAAAAVVWKLSGNGAFS